MEILHHVSVINIDIRGVRGVSQSTCHALLAVAYARFCPPTVSVNGFLTTEAHEKAKRPSPKYVRMYRGEHTNIHHVSYSLTSFFRSQMQ